MHESIWQTIAYTPWWMIVLFGYLAHASYLATKPSALPIRKLIFLPVFFFVASLLGMFILVKPNTANLACWAVMLLLGTGLGWLQFRVSNIKASKEDRTLHIPGTWSALILLIAAISAKYYFGFQLNLSPELFQTTPYANALMGLYGFVTGLFIGRSYYAVHAAKHGPFALSA